ncbi:hypothetical protein L7F22_055656 [Adiantum nelumboides]|nr:hypothetical protein [Adiantum nelumboides]
MEGAFACDRGLRLILHKPLYKLFCKRASLRLHFASFRSGTKASLAVVMPVSNISEANVLADQGCASSTLETMIVHQTHQYSKLESSKGSLELGKNYISSSSLLTDKVQERLNQLDNMVQQHVKSIALMSAQLETQRQSLNSVLEELKQLKMDSRCKEQCPSSPPNNTASLDIVDVYASGAIGQGTHPWPEWTHFIKHLRSLPSLKDLVQACDVHGVSPADVSTSIKRTLANFSQAYDYIFNALSVTHLRTLTDYGCPNDERRTVASFKRLKDHFRKQEKKCIASSNLNSANPRLSDVMRLLYVIAELAQKDGPPDNLKRSVLHLLEEITKLTSTPKDGHIDRSKTSSNSSAVLQTASRKKSYCVHAELGLQGSSSSSESESLAGSSNWECPRCSHYNHESKNACVQCNFQRPEKSDPIFDTGTPKSRFPVANKSETKVGGEDEEPSIFASKRPTEMIILDDDNCALSMGELPQNKRLLGTQEQLFQTCTMSGKEDEVFGVAEDREDNDAGDLNIFDDIFDKRDTSPGKSGPKRSLSELIRENKKAFSLTRKERGHGIKGLGPFTDRGQEYDENDAGERTALQRPHVQDVSDLETEGKCMSMQQSRGNRGRAAQNHFNSLAGSVGKGLGVKLRMTTENGGPRACNCMTRMGM